MQFLTVPPEDLQVLTAVLEHARTLRDERDRALANYVSARTAGLTAQAITKWIARNFKSS